MSNKAPFCMLTTKGRIHGIHVMQMYCDWSGTIRSDSKEVNFFYVAKVTMELVRWQDVSVVWQPEFRHGILWRTASLT